MRWVQLRSHFIDGETEAQRGAVTGLRSHSVSELTAHSSKPWGPWLEDGQGELMDGGVEPIWGSVPPPPTLVVKG